MLAGKGERARPRRRLTTSEGASLRTRRSPSCGDVAAQSPIGKDCKGLHLGHRHPANERPPTSRCTVTSLSASETEADASEHDDASSTFLADLPLFSGCARTNVRRAKGSSEDLCSQRRRGTTNERKSTRGNGVVRGLGERGTRCGSEHRAPASTSVEVPEEEICARGGTKMFRCSRPQSPRSGIPIPRVAETVKPVEAKRNDVLARAVPPRRSGTKRSTPPRVLSRQPPLPTRRDPRDEGMMSRCRTNRHLCLGCQRAEAKASGARRVALSFLLLLPL